MHRLGDQMLSTRNLGLGSRGNIAGDLREPVVNGRMQVL
jgi:hypothetical protein